MGKTNGYGNSAVFRRPTGPGYDADAAAYFAAVTTPFSTARKAIINTLVTTLKADGNWAGLDRLWLMANEASDQGLISLVNPASTAMTLVNAPTFTVDQGFTGDGLTTYINTGYTPNVDGIKFTLNSASMGVYSRTQVSAGEADMGEGDTYNTDLLVCFSGTGYARISSAGVNGANASSVGFFAAVQDATTGFFYKNGTSQFSAANTGELLASLPLWILARNLSGNERNNTKEISIAFTGSSSISQ